MTDDEFLIDCANCGNPIDEEQYNRTGTDEYCDNCDIECSDPRGHTFENCGCLEDSE